jgi:hypothetical protein
VRGVLFMIFIPLEETTHTRVEIDGFRRGGDP